MAPRPSASASSPPDLPTRPDRSPSNPSNDRRPTDERQRRHLDSRHQHDQVREASRSRHRRPRGSGHPGRPRRRRRDHGPDGHPGRRQPHGWWRHRPAAPEAGRPDRHPGLQRGQRLCHRSHCPADRDHGRQGWRVRHGPRGRGGEAGRSRPARRRRQVQGQGQRLRAERPLRRRCPDRRPDRDRHHARRLRPGRHGVRPQVRRGRLRALRQDQREEPLALHPQPPGRLHQGHVGRPDHERRHDRLPKHPADVLGQL